MNLGRLDVLTIGNPDARTRTRWILKYPSTPKILLLSPHAPAGRVAAIQIKLPLFWPKDPALWFAQIEAQFTTHGMIWHHRRFQDEVRVRRLIVFSRVCDGSPGPTTYSTCRASLRATKERANQPNLAVRATPSPTATYFRRAWRS